MLLTCTNACFLPLFCSCFCLKHIRERLDKSPPGSPPVYRRQTSREENVFSRLTQQQLNNSNRLPGKITTHIPKVGWILSFKTILFTQFL